MFKYAAELFSRLTERFTASGTALTDHIYVFLSMTVGFILIGSSIVRYYETGSVGLVLALAASGAEFLIICALSVRAKRYSVGAVLCSTFMLIAVVPATVFAEGGVSGGGAVCILAMLTYVWVVNTGVWRTIFTCGMLIAAAAAHWFAYAHPDFLWSFDSQVLHLHSLLNLIVIFALSALLIQVTHTIIERERAKVIAQKSEIEKLIAAQSVFFSKISHEIRTPINAIIGLNELTMRSEAPPAVLENAEAIQGASKILLALVNDVIDVSKISFGGIELDRSEYDTAEMLRDVVEMERRIATQKGLAFDLIIDGDIPAVMFGDASRIRQILINILSNAIKFTVHGSVSLMVRCERVSGDRVDAVFEVSDTGIGIKREEMSTLFSVFGRLDVVSNRNVEGSGLGLSIVKSLLELMGGTISVDSVYTKGSTFRVVIPQDRVGSDLMAIHDLYEHPANVAVERRTFAQKHRLLIVDDNDMNRRVAHDLLALSGLESDTADSGQACLELTKTNAYDVILMDHFMPGMDGVETMHRIRAQNEGANTETPIIVLTANAEQNEDNYRSLGFSAYLPKPIMPDVLERTIFSLLPGYQSPAAVARAPAARSLRRRKRRIMITAESVCDISAEMKERFGISTIPIPMILSDGRRYLDEVEIDARSLEKCLSAENITVATVSPSRDDYEKFFADKLTDAERIIHITLPGRDLGDEFSIAKEASSVFGSIDVVPAGAVSTGQGLLACLTSQRAMEGAGRDDLLSFVNKTKREISFNCFIGDPDIFASTRRLSPIARAMAKSLMLNPTISYVNDGMKLKRFEIGIGPDARQKFVERTLRRAPAIKGPIFVTYAGISRDELDNIERMIRERFGFGDVVIIRASAGIFANSGAGTIAITYTVGSHAGGGYDLWQEMLTRGGRM